MRLLPMMAQCTSPKIIAMDEKIFSKEKITELVDIIENFINEKVMYLAISGDRTEEAYNFLMKKYEKSIINNKYHFPIVKEKEIYIPMKKYDLVWEDPRVLSHLDLNVMVFSDEVATSYLNGKDSSFYFVDAMSFSSYLTARGYFYDEFLYARIINRVVHIDKELADKMIEYLGTPLLNSLIKVFNFEDTVNDRTYVNTRINELVTVLRKKDFNKIKDYHYEFVRSFVND